MTDPARFHQDDIQLPEGVVPGAPDLEMREFAPGRMKMRKRTAALSRESISAVFNLWAVSYRRGGTDVMPPTFEGMDLIRDLTDEDAADSRVPPSYADDCAQTFLDMAVELWPSDESLAVLQKQSAPRIVSSTAMPKPTPKQEQKGSKLWRMIKSKFA